jgi:hypothetical protein
MKMYVACFILVWFLQQATYWFQMFQALRTLCVHLNLVAQLEDVFNPLHEVGSIFFGQNLNSQTFKYYKKNYI